MIQFDILLKELGAIGTAQIILSCFLAYKNIPAGINSLATVFIAYTPDWRCNVPPLDNVTAYPNLTESDILNLTTPYNSTTQTYDGCRRYGYDLQACEGDTSCVNKSYPPIKCDNGYHYDRSIFTETVVTEFDMVCDRKYLNTLSTSMYYLAMLIASLVFGNFADTFGRKTCVLVTHAACMACMLGLSFSRSVALYIVLRMGISGFNFGTTIGAFVYVMEIIGKKWRTVVGMAFQMVFPFGYMIFGGVAYHWRGWHEMMLVSTILSLPLLVFAIIIPESPRWLFTHNKEKQAIKVTERMARLNKVKLSDEIWQEARKVGEESKLKHSSSDKNYTSLDLFRHRGTLIITLKLTLIWFVNSLVYYGVSLNAGSLAGDIFLNNTLNGVFETCSYVSCMLVMDRIGRKLLLSFFFLLSGLALIASVIVNTYAGNDNGLVTLGVVFAFIGKYGISGSFAVTYNFTTELYPTVVRSNGFGMASVAARIAGILAPYIIVLQDYIQWLPNTIFGVFGCKQLCLGILWLPAATTGVNPRVIAGIVALSLPETNGHYMMETIEEAEQFYKSGKSTTQRDENLSRIDSFEEESGHHNKALEEEDEYTRM